ncbi:MAG: ABC transporter ATP-binding protein [Bacteroidaceae bacterium]|nr:ABC transporter ATP-binding protein [Bacteroidaceae bacterium]
MNAIEFENIGKQYRLGLVSSGTISHDLNRWWTMNVLRKEDPYLRIGETNDRAHRGKSDYVWALKDINFSVEEGDVVGIIGKNGAGKSTLLKLLSRVTAPTTGTIRARGRIASLLEVGTGFHPEMTGRENIYMNGAIMGMTKAEITRKLDEIVDFSGCERYIDTPVKRYSSGMTVRLGFAIAAHLEPEILVVDEVLAVGDAEFQKKAIGKMQDVSRGEGRTVLFVSHNMAAVRRLCKKGVVLANGQLHYQGEINSAIDEYMMLSFAISSGTSVANLPRTGKCSGKIKFIGIEFLDRNNMPITPHCGQFLRIRLKLNAVEKLNGCRISLGVYDMFGSILTTFPTDVTMDSFHIEKGEHYAILDIEKLPLTVGSYRLLLWSDIYKECADYIDRIIIMNVEQDDFYGLGREIPSHVFGKVVLCEHKWSV